MNLKEQKQKMVMIAETGDFTNALVIADQILVTDIADRDAIRMKAGIMAIPDPNFANPGAALVLVNDALKNDPTNGDRWADAGEIYSLVGEYGYAILCFKKALELAPRNYDALLGLTWETNHQLPFVSPEEARELLLRAVQVEPDRWQAYHALGYNFRDKLKDKKLAKEYFNAALARLSENDQRMRKQIEKELKQLDDLVA